MPAASLWTPTARQRWFVVGLILFFIICSVPYSFKVTEHYGASAFLRWRPQLLALDAGENIYDLYTYPNPPIMALLLLPLAQLPPLAGALTWFYLKVVMTLLALFWVFRLVESPARPFPEWAKVLTVLLSLRPLMGDLSHGNVNLFLMFLVVAALHAYRQGRDFGAGLTLALAIACKVTPALFVPYFLWKRAWKTLAGCALGLPLFLLVLPGLYLGQHRNLELLASWGNQMVKPFLVDGVVCYSEHNNQSIPGLVFRLATHSPSFSDHIDNIHYTPLHYHNFAALSPRAAQWIIKGCMALFTLAIVWSCRTPTTPRTGWRLSAEFSLVILGMLLFSERTWKHHCVTLVLPLAVLSYSLALSSNWRMRSFLAACLTLVFLLMVSTGTVKQLGWWEESAKLAQTYGAYVWAYLAQTAALVVLLRLQEPLPEASGA